MAHAFKDNGLPAGSGLYWKDESRTQIWIRISHNGVAKSYPSGTDEWKKALLERDRIKAQLLSGERKQAVNRAVRIDELLDDYIAELKRKQATRGEYGTDTPYKTECAINRHVRPHFGRLKAANLTTADLNGYRDRRMAEYAAKKAEAGSGVIAINRELAYLRAAMRLGMKTTPKKVVSYPSFPIDTRAEKLRARKGVIASQHYELLVAHAPEHLKPILPFVVYSGVRAKELRVIRRSQVDWERLLISLKDGETKEGIGRDVPIVDVAVEPLRKWMDYTAEFYPSCEWLFHFNGRRMASMKTAWNATCRRAGLVAPMLDAEGKPVLNKRGKPTLRNTVRFHDTRRTAITIQGRAGVTESDSQRVTGHSTIEVHRRYDQDKDAATRTRTAINTYLNGGMKATSQEEPAKSGADPVARIQALAQLAEMHKIGQLTDAEFADLKSQLLA